MTRVQPLTSIPVGVVIERRKAKSAWVGFVWRPTAVLPGVPDTAPWTAIDGDADHMNFYGGAGRDRVVPHPTRPAIETIWRRERRLLWVVLRPTGLDPPYEIAAVTAEPSEGEAFTESATDIVEAVPMPEPVRAAVAEFVAKHHVEHPFVKRERDRADPETMAWRRASSKDHK